MLSYLNLKTVYHIFSVYPSSLLTCLNALRCLLPSSFWAWTHPLNHIGRDMSMGESINKLGSILFCHTFHCDTIKSIAYLNAEYLQPSKVMLTLLVLKVNEVLRSTSGIGWVRQHMVQNYYCCYPSVLPFSYFTSMIIFLFAMC